MSTGPPPPESRTGTLRWSSASDGKAPVTWLIKINGCHLRELSGRTNEPSLRPRGKAQRLSFLLAFLFAFHVYSFRCVQGLAMDLDRGSFAASAKWWTWNGEGLRFSRRRIAAREELSTRFDLRSWWEGFISVILTLAQTFEPRLKFVVSLL